jgi:hypothetical protein
MPNSTPAQDRYITVDNGDGTHSLRDTVDSCWIERDGKEDMLPHQAASLLQEYLNS